MGFSPIRQYAHDDVGSFSSMCEEALNTCNNVQIMHRMQASMKRGISSDPFQCKPEITFFKVIFLFQMTYLGVLYERD